VSLARADLQEGAKAGRFLGFEPERRRAPQSKFFSLPIFSIAVATSIRETMSITARGCDAPNERPAANVSQPASVRNGVARRSVTAGRTEAARAALTAKAEAARAA
jgi:hypothetical protein